MKRRRHSVRSRGLPAVALVVGGVLVIATPAGASIAPRGQTSSAVFAADSTTSLTVSAPGGSQVGDVLVAALGFGRKGTKRPPLLSAPAGWTLVSRTDQKSATSLAVYRHVFAAGENAHTFRTDVAVGGTAFVAAYGGVDASSPIDVSAAATATNSTSVAAPSVTTTAGGDVLVAAYAGLAKGGTITSWSAPDGMAELGDAGSGGRSGTIDETVQATAGATGARTARASVIQNSGVGTLIALRAATVTQPPTPSGPVPLIVDTDIFSDADDVGTLATAYGLQLRGEAKVIAVGVNTRMSRPAVAIDSWKCVTAINRFYGAPDVPIGTHLPNDGTEVNTADFAGPCGRLAPASTPAPASTVQVFRRALAGQADGSVVVASAGYFGNLSDLLKSPPDAISPLSGRDLVARKVRTLVAMAGGYPSRSVENNLAGDPATAQYVSANWPTKLVWDGYEVGDTVHTGQSISSVHPQTSPVRVAYEAFVGPGNWIYSYDLTALYHAVHPAGSPLREVGPGTNAIDGAGGNVFTAGTGTQYYLTLSDAGALATSIEALLDTLPASAPPAPSAGLNDAFDGSALDAARWVAESRGSSIAVSGGELQISHPAGAWTSGAITSAAPPDIAGHAVSVQVKRAANNGLGGQTYGEASIVLRIDQTHYAELFIAGGSLTAWVNRGSGETKLTPAWPSYFPTAMQWLRLRESAGTLYFEYASGTTTPGTWTTLASTASPFGTSHPVLRIAAGANTTTTDVARFDNVATG